VGEDRHYIDLGDMQKSVFFVSHLIDSLPIGLGQETHQKARLFVKGATLGPACESFDQSAMVAGVHE
jgi:hypothetical protein